MVRLSLGSSHGMLLRRRSARLGGLMGASLTDGPLGKAPCPSSRSLSRPGVVWRGGARDVRCGPALSPSQATGCGWAADPHWTASARDLIIAHLRGSAGGGQWPPCLPPAPRPVPSSAPQRSSGNSISILSEIPRQTRQAGRHLFQTLSPALENAHVECAWPNRP